MLKFKGTRAAHDCIGLIVGNGAIPIITKLARVIPDSTFIIDHIITNESNHKINSFIFEVDVIDHYQILCKNRQKKIRYSKKLSQCV